MRSWCRFVLAAVGALAGCNATGADVPAADADVSPADVETEEGAGGEVEVEIEVARSEETAPPEVDLATHPEGWTPAVAFTDVERVLPAGFCDTVGFDGTLHAGSTGDRFADVTNASRVDTNGKPVSGQLYTAGLAIADFDGNGTPDLVTIGHGPMRFDGETLSPKVVGDGKMKLLANCGGFFVEAFDFHEAFGDGLDLRGVAIAAVDVDGDAFTDVVLATVEGPLYLFRFLGYADGAFSFAPPVDLAASLPPAGPTKFSTLSFWDFDANGRLDVFFGRMDPDAGHVSVDEVTISDPVLLQDAAGGFTDASETPKWAALKAASSYQTCASLVLPFPPGDGRYLLYGGMDGGIDFFALFTPGADALPDVQIIEVPQKSWMKILSVANTMGADFECTGDEECRLVTTDFGAPHSFHVTRSSEPEISFATEIDFGTSLEAAHSLWSATFVDVDRDGRREVLAAGSETAVKGPKGPGGLVPEESLVMYGVDDLAGHFVDVSKDMGPRFTTAAPGHWGMAFVSDLDGDGDLDAIAAPFPRVTEIYMNLASMSDEEYADYQKMIPDFDLGSPLTFLHYTEGPRDGRAVFVRLRGPGHRVVGSRIEVACQDPAACAGFEGLLQEVGANGNFIGSTREIGVWEFPVGTYEGLVDVRITARDGATFTVIDVPVGATLDLEAP